MAGGIFKSAVGTIGGMVAEASKGVEEAYREACEQCSCDSKLRDELKLGVTDEVVFSPPLQQATSSTVVNGVQRRSVTLGFLAEGPGGRAQVRAVYTADGKDSAGEMAELVALLPDGRRIEVNGGGGGGGGIIDVDADVIDV